MLYMVAASLAVNEVHISGTRSGATLLANPREHQEYPKGEGGMNGVQNR